MKRYLHLLWFFIFLFLVSCGNGDNTAIPSADKPEKGKETAAEPYIMWSDSIKAMGLRGDLTGAREMLRTFQNSCLDGSAARDFKHDGEEAKKTLYIAWSNVISYLFNKGEILEAIDEVQTMQKYAEKGKDEFGIAMVEVTYGGLYTYSFKESIEHLRKALAYWEKSENVPQMQYTLYMLSRELLGQAENTDSASLNPRIYAEILSNSDRIENLDSANTYMKQVGEYLRLMVHVATKDGEAAKKSYHEVKEWWQKGEIVPQLKGMMANTMAQYLVTFDNPALATPLLTEINLPLYRLQTERLQSIALGNYRRATELQSQIDKMTIQRINQLQEMQLAIANAAFNNIQLERHNHQLEMERLENERRLVMTSIIAVALLLVIIVLLVYQRRISHKNMELVQRIKAQEEADKKTLTLAVANAGQLTPEVQLFLRIEQLLQDETVLTNPELDREMIASRLGTNRTYVAQAISECADGKSVSGYINSLRVRLGRRLLEDPQKSIEEIVYASGFSSRSHFHNLFVAEYGITPAQFRKTLKRL